MGGRGWGRRGGREDRRTSGFLRPSLAQVLEGDPGEDPQVHACKLLEVIVLQCQRRIDVVGVVLTFDP